MIRWKRSWPDLSEAAPLDVLPASNGEFAPRAPDARELEIMRLQDEGIEHWRRKFNMSRRDFVRTAAAMAVGFWAMDTVNAAYAHNTETTAACDLEFDDEDFMSDFWLGNKPGEFIFDVQSHHVESDGMWRVTNPGFEAFFSAVWSQAGPLGGFPGMREDGSVRGFGAGELDPIENLSRYHYLKELFLDSATTMTVLSAVPAAPDITQPLPIERAALTAQMVNQLSGSDRTVMHAFVMPNRGSFGTVASSFDAEPVYMQREFEIMEERAIKYNGLIRGWKTYPAWGDIPYASGWFFDDEKIGIPFIRKVIELSKKYNMPPNIATHKGFALPAFDQRAASPRDIGPVARRFGDPHSEEGFANFIVYHSGYDGEAMGPYPGDANVNSADRRVDSLIKSLRENNWDATAFGSDPAKGVWANVPNVYAEIGSTWRSNMSNDSNAIHLLGKLITYVGPKRIAWGTDSLWFGSPQSEIAGLRRLKVTPQNEALWMQYNLPYGIDGDASQPNQLPSDPKNSIRNWIFGRAAAVVYGVDADAHLKDRAHLTAPAGPVLSSTGKHDTASGFNCDEIQKIRDAYIVNQMTPKEQAPMASNTIIGPRTPKDLFAMRAEEPWGP